MQQIPLQILPNQTLTIQMNSILFDIALREANGIMAVDIFAGGEAIVLGMRAVSGTPLIPYRYLQNFGNFVFVTEKEEYPYYTQFGITQFLIFATSEELGALNAT